MLHLRSTTTINKSSVYIMIAITILLITVCQSQMILFEQMVNASQVNHTQPLKYKSKSNRRSMLLSGNDPISNFPSGFVLPGISYFNKIYNMFDGTDLLEKSGRDIFTFRYSTNVQTWTSPTSYWVPVEFTGVPNIHPQCNKDTSLTTMKNTWSSTIITETSSSKTSNFGITIPQIAAILSPIINIVAPGLGSTMTTIANSDAFKDTKASIENGNSRNTKFTEIKRGEGFQKKYRLSAETSLYEAGIAWDQLQDFSMKPEFLSAIDDLEFTGSNLDIMDFISKWGTHVINNAKMGAVCEETVYLKTSKSNYDYNDFYQYTQTKKSGLLFWSSSSTTTTAMTQTGTYGSYLFYEFTNIRCEGECPTTQFCGGVTGTQYFPKPVEYNLIPIWDLTMTGLLSIELAERFQIFVANIMDALLKCRVNRCNNKGICTLKDNVFTSQFISSWDGITFDDMIDYNRACYCEGFYIGNDCGALPKEALEFRVCFQETEGSSQCQLSRSGCSEWSFDPDAAWTPEFRDDTDGRGGGCRYQWKLESRTISNNYNTYSYRVCFKENEGSSQCQMTRNSCSGWSNVPSWNAMFRDDTDGRGGGCKYQWKIEQQEDMMAISQIDGCRICFYESEGSSQCQGSRSSCSGWTDYVLTDYWTASFRDDTDGRGGGCKYQWKIECH